MSEAADDRCIRVTGIYGNLILVRPEDIVKMHDGTGCTHMYTTDGAWRRIRESAEAVARMAKGLKDRA